MLYYNELQSIKDVRTKIPGCCLSKAKACGLEDEYIRNIERDAIIIIYINS